MKKGKKKSLFLILSPPLLLLLLLRVLLLLFLLYSSCVNDFYKEGFSFSYRQSLAHPPLAFSSIHCLSRSFFPSCTLRAWSDVSLLHVSPYVLIKVVVWRACVFITVALLHILP